jgi:transposase-like protein
MARFADPGTQHRWLSLVRLWQQSQLTVRAFCARHRLSEPSFYAWRRLLRERGLMSEPARQPTRAPSTPAAFVEVTPNSEPATPTPIDLVVNDRRLLRVRPGFDPDTLLVLIRLLERQPC